VLFEHAQAHFAGKSWVHHLTKMSKNEGEIAVGLGVEHEEKVAKEFKDVFDDKSTHLGDIDRKTLRQWLKSELDDEAEEAEMEPSRPINSSDVKETFVCFTEEARTKLKFAAIDAKLFTPADAEKETDILQLSFPDGIFDNSKGNNNVIVVAFPEDIR
jgi:hypothetical protein